MIIWHTNHKFRNQGKC